MKRFECNACGHAWLGKSHDEKGSACPNCTTETVNVKVHEVGNDAKAGMQPLNRPTHGTPEIKPVVAVKGPTKPAKRGAKKKGRK